MGRILVINLLFIVIFLGLYGALTLGQYLPILSMALLFVLFLILLIYLGATAAYVRGISDFKPYDFKEYFSFIGKTWKTSLTGGLVFSVVIILTVLGMRFYSSMGGMLGLLGTIFLFWVFVTVNLAYLYYYPVVQRLESSKIRMIKKSFLIFLDNPFLTIGVFFGLLFNMVLSVVTVFLIPGPAGAMLWLDNNLRLLVYKYDYLEENPEAGKKIPWRALTFDDNEKIGPRTFRNTIFPWK